VRTRSRILPVGALPRGSVRRARRVRVAGELHRIGRASFLRSVRDLTAEFVARQAGLGICFAATLGAGVGAEVRRAEAPRWVSRRAADGEGGGRSIRGFPEVFPAAQWHYDAFAIPRASWLACSALCRSRPSRRAGASACSSPGGFTAQVTSGWSSTETNCRGPQEPEQMLADFARTAAERCGCATHSWAISCASRVGVPDDSRHPHKSCRAAAVCSEPSRCTSDRETVDAHEARPSNARLQ